MFIVIFVHLLQLPNCEFAITVTVGVRLKCSTTEVHSPTEVRLKSARTTLTHVSASYHTEVGSPHKIIASHSNIEAQPTVSPFANCESSQCLRSSALWLLFAGLKHASQHVVMSYLALQWHLRVDAKIAPRWWVWSVSLVIAGTYTVRSSFVQYNGDGMSLRKKKWVFSLPTAFLQ